MAQYNMKNPSVKRIMQEAREMASETSQDYAAHPLEDNIFEWHFTIRGPPDTDFAGGLYHGRILLPPEYPFKPPSIILLTPNGRFEVGKKICLSISDYHPEYWQPSWSVRTVLVALIGFMPTKPEGAIGSLDYTPEERRNLAQTSLTWVCDRCGRPQDQITDAQAHAACANLLQQVGDPIPRQSPSPSPPSSMPQIVFRMEAPTPSVATAPEPSPERSPDPSSSPLSAPSPSSTPSGAPSVEPSPEHSPDPSSSPLSAPSPSSAPSGAPSVEPSPALETSRCAPALSSPPLTPSAPARSPSSASPPAASPASSSAPANVTAALPGTAPESSQPDTLLFIAVAIGVAILALLLRRILLLRYPNLLGGPGA